jgi:hypothetical protein
MSLKIGIPLYDNKKHYNWKGVGIDSGVSGHFKIQINIQV